MQFKLPKKLWEVASKKITDPVYKGLGSQGGRPAADFELVLTGIVYWARTGCQVENIPSHFGSPSTIKRYLRRWIEAGIFEEIWREALKIYDEEIGINWKWQSIDGAMKKSPYCVEKAGPNPTDRAKSGTKISILTDKNGIPISAVVAPANRNDNMLMEATLEAIQIQRPDPTDDKQNLCADKGYDSQKCRDTANEWGLIDHILSRGDEIKKKRNKRFTPKRWVVERTHSWLNGFRGIFVRWARSAEVYQAFIAIASSKLILCKLK
jgi:putative transposase